MLSQNISKLNSKWNLDLEQYLHASSELINIIPEKREQPLQILDISCGCGINMAKLKSRFPVSTLYGIEKNPNAASIAVSYGQISCIDIEQSDLPYSEETFDYCFLGNVLEYLQHPQEFLTKLHNYLKKNGCIVLSVSNIKHWSVLLPLLQNDEFSYSDSGILDTSHSKMYTLREILRLLLLSGYEIENYTYTASGEPSREEQEMIIQKGQY